MSSYSKFYNKYYKFCMISVVVKLAELAFYILFSEVIWRLNIHFDLNSNLYLYYWDIFVTASNF